MCRFENAKSFGQTLIEVYFTDKNYASFLIGKMLILGAKFSLPGPFSYI
jgi:hypothetical protein